MNERERARREVAFEDERSGIAALRRELEKIAHWIPARGLRELAASREAMLADLRERLHAKPVVAIVGPTGCGKSTLVNALAGRDELVTTGEDRPTTRDVAVISRSSEDAGPLLDHIPREQVRVVPFPSTLLGDAIVLDTPDTDSAECVEHRDLLHRALQLCDVLLCVFDASNPKRRDNIEALADWVNTFPGEQVYLVLNRCDRIPEDELRAAVVPDFLAHISRSWARKHDEVFRVSARSALQTPRWPESEQPLHDLNETVGLRRRLQEIGGGAFFADRRIERARHLRAVIAEAVREKAQGGIQELAGIRADLAALERRVSDETVEAVSGAAGEDRGGMTALMYSALAQRWWGPIGFFVGVWRRLVDFWTPMSFLRSVNPFGVAAALVKSLRAITNPAKFEQELAGALGGSLSPRESVGARITIAREWPDLAERLVRAGFDPAVRNGSMFLDMDPLLDLSAQTWGAAVKKAVDDAAGRLSTPLLQWALNAPALAGFVAAGVYIVRGFVVKVYLPGAFFLHAAALVLVLWLPFCWLLQVLAHRAQKRIAKDALDQARDMLRTGVGAHGDRAGITDEIDRIIRLAGATQEPTRTG